MRPLLLGGTDLTLAVAKHLATIGMAPAGIVHVGRRFAISYSVDRVNNARFAELGAWCHEMKIEHRAYSRADDILALVGRVGGDFMLAAGWYHHVPKRVRAQFAHGAAGLHASLLPRLRGGAPLNWAILSGASETGVSLFALADGVDDGPIYGQRRIAIGPRTTIGELVTAAETAALHLIGACLPEIASGRLKPTPQQGEPSYGLQRVPEDGRIDWRQPAHIIDRLVRAVGRPYSGAFGVLGGAKAIVWRAEPLTPGPQVFGAPGQIVGLADLADPCVVTGQGVLAVHEVSDEQGADLLPRLRRAANQRFDC